MALTHSDDGKKSFLCSLHAEGVSLNWRFRPSERAKGTLISRAELLPCDELQAAMMPIRSLELAMTINDIEAVAAYLENHVSALRADAFCRSNVLMRYDVPFQLEAGEGEVREHDDGQFAMTVLLPVGASLLGTQVYAGVSAQVSVEATKRFMKEVMNASLQCRT